ncbi:MAG TPA: hypothetical protein VI854_05940, partial [Acidimicrobiia bacterium]|nr:hypothetical protein [Acidimicrobiia bacterium]
GGIFSFGDAAFHGSTGDIRLNQPITGMASTPSGAGYWMVASDGGIFSFGDAAFHGSTGAIKLNKPIVGMASTPSGAGYWLVATDGGIFSFGDAAFYGSTGAIVLNQPITGMAATPTGAGYWMTATDGGVFSFGDAGFFGAAPERPLRPGDTRRIVAMVPTSGGKGYWQVSATGEILAFGDAPAVGAPTSLNRELVGMAAVPRGARSPGTSAPVNPGPGNPGPTTTTTAPNVQLPPPETFSPTPNPTWGTSDSETESDKAGRVLALAEIGDTIFLGGEFTGVEPPGGGPAVTRPYLVALDRNTGALLEWDAHPNEAVLSLAASPDGRRLYAGGRFTAIGGGSATRIAAVDVATGLLDTTFRPPKANSGVRSMALRGDTLYVGGNFEELDGQAFPQLAALDAGSGAIRAAFDPPSNGGGHFVGQTGEPTTGDGDNGLVYDLALTADGSMLIAVGDFLDFGGQGGVLVLDPASGQKTSWQPDMDRPVFGVSASPADPKTFYVSTGGTGGQVQAFKGGGKSESPLWYHRVDGDATDVTATAKRVYLVGHYDWVLGKNTVCGAPPCEGGAEGDVPNRHVSAFDTRTGAHDVDFNAQLNTPQGPYVALVGADHLYIGGDFTKVDGHRQQGFVQFPSIR